MLTELPADSYRHLREEAGVVEMRRDVIRVTGPQAAEYLQGQLTQDVDVSPGSSVLSLLLEPQGKVSSFLRVSRLGPDSFLLDTEAGFGPSTAARLARFKLRTRIDIDLEEDWETWAVRGPARPPAPADLDDAGPVVAPFDWPGLEGYDLLFPPGVDQVDLGLPGCDPRALEALRIESGLPRLGRELTEATIPEEAGVVAATVSFTKGCYTGQELVARIDSRGGNVARRLRGLVATGEGAETIAVGDGLWVSGAEVGRVTSSAHSPRLGPVGLAYIHRRFEPPLVARAGSDGTSAEVDVEVRALPLTPPARATSPSR